MLTELPQIDPINPNLLAAIRKRQVRKSKAATPVQANTRTRRNINQYESPSNRVKRLKKPSSTRSLPSVERVSNNADSDDINDKLSGQKVELPSLVSQSFKSRHELRKNRRKRKAREARLKKIERYRKLLNDSPETRLVLGSQHQSEVRLMLRLFFCQAGCMSTWTRLRSYQAEIEAAYTQSSASHAGTLWSLAWLGDMDGLERMAKDKPNDVVAVINAYKLGCAPLHAAIQRNHHEVVKFLLSKGADPDLMTERGLCPLDMAIFAGDLPLVIILLSHHASVNRSDKNGNTLVMLAAFNGDFDMLCILVDNGASTSRRNNEGHDTEDVLQIVHGKTLVQALSEGATMRAQKTIDKRALRRIEAGWGSIGDGFETMIPVADAEALVHESGIRGHNAGLWQQVLAEASHVMREKKSDAASTTSAQDSESTISFEQFLNSYHRFLRSKLNFTPPSAEGIVDDDDQAEDSLDFTSVIRTFEKGDDNTLPFSQQLMDYTNTKIEAVYANKSSDALRVLWGTPQRLKQQCSVVRFENDHSKLQQLQMECKESCADADRHFENVRIRLDTVQRVTQISVLPLELEHHIDLSEIGLMVAVHLRNEVRKSKQRWRKQATELFERIDKALAEKTAKSTLKLVSEELSPSNKTSDGVKKKVERLMLLPTSYELMTACKSNDWRQIRQILARVRIANNQHIAPQANVNEMARDGYSALMVAVCYGNLRAIRELILAGANVDQLAPDGSTSLQIAADEGNYKVVQALLNGGADCNLSLSNGATALHLAVLCGNHRVVKVMLAAAPPTCCKCNVNKTAAGGLSALHLAAHEGHSECIRLLAKAPNIDLNRLSDAGATPLMIAVKMGKYDAAKALLEAGVVLNVGANAPGTALPYLAVAVAQGDYWLTHLLLEYGAKLDFVRGRNGNSEAMVAAISGDFDILYLLVTEHGASTTAQNDEGQNVAAILDKLYHISLDTALDFGERMDKPPRGKMVTYVDLEISRQVFENAIGVTNSKTNTTKKQTKQSFYFTKSSFRQMLLEMGMLSRLEHLGRVDAVLDLIADSPAEEARSRFRMGFRKFQLLFRQLRRLLLFEDNVHESVASAEKRKMYTETLSADGHIQAVVGSFLETDDKLWRL